MSKVTISPTLASPPTVPVTRMLAPASAALMMSSAVMFGLSVIVGTGGTSSSIIVAVPCASAINAPPVGLVRFTTKVSAVSTTPSFKIGMVMICVVTPAAKVAVLLVVV